MNLEAILIGIIPIVGSIVLFLLEKSTPKNELVPTRPWIYQSHEAVRISIFILLIMGAILIIMGLIL